MKLPRAALVVTFVFGCALIAKAAENVQALVWDSELKEIRPATNQTTAHFSFSVTNVSRSTVVINDVEPSCGCTLVNMPAKPWILGPGTSGHLEVEVDLMGKSGLLIKTLSVISSVGKKDLVFKVRLPEMVRRDSSLAERVRRLRNQKMALGDRQAVFRNDCARCHVQPASGKMGQPLYEKACGICHDAVHRASMVPDLTGLPHANEPEYWANWIANGKEGSLMPAFGEAAGGPLTKAQIESLVSYLSTRERHPGSASSLPATEQ
jgi:cytochrome c553